MGFANRNKEVGTVSQRRVLWQQLEEQNKIHDAEKGIRYPAEGIVQGESNGRFSSPGSILYRAISRMPVDGSGVVMM